MNTRFLLSLLIVFTASFGVLRADSKLNPAKWTLVSSPKSVKAGDTLWCKVKVQLDDLWHIYGLNSYSGGENGGPDSTAFFSDDKSFSVLKNRIHGTKAISLYDSSFEIHVNEYKKVAEFNIPLLCSPKTIAKKHTFNLVVHFQVCTDQNCLAARDVPMPLSVEVLAGDPKKSSMNSGDELGTGSAQPGSPSSTSPATDAAAGAASAAAAQDKEKSPSARATVDSKSEASAGGTGTPVGMLGLLIAAISAGAVSWLMPCVYPMIPITVSFFTKRSNKEHTKPIIDSLVYSGGIMSTYVVFGAVIAIIFGPTASRSFASNPWVNLMLGLIFVIIAGNLFGMYELALPSSLVNSLNRKSRESHGYSSSFIMGMVFSLTAFTCTVPFVSTIGDISSHGEWFRPLVGMTVYGVVFAFPFFLLALFPTVLTKLPRSGAWMNNIKVVFGFVELAFALSYFARTDSLNGWGFISREAVLSVWAACGILTMLYILGVFRMKLDSPVEHVGGFRALLAVGFGALSLYIFDGIKSDSVGPLESFVYVESAHTGSQPSLTSARPAVSGGTEAKPTNDSYTGDWIEDLDSGLAYAKKLGRPVFVDFTGKSCTNCRWMEKNMFTKDEVKNLMSKMVLVRAFTDRSYVPRDKVYQQMEEQRFNSTLLPLYVLLTPNNEVIASSTYTPDVNTFVQFLQQAGSNQAHSSVSELIRP